MPETATISESKSAGAAELPRWSPLVCLITAPFFPARTARCTNHVPLPVAWGIHALTAILTVLEFVMVGILVPMPEWNLTTVVERFDHLITRLAQAMQRNPQGVLVKLCFVVCGIELGVVAFGLVIVPWGARVENLWDSIAHALRRTWLQTPHVFWGIALVTLLFLPWYRTAMHWRRLHPAPEWSLSVAQPGPNATATELNAFQKAMTDAQEEYFQRHQKYQSSQPFHVRYDDDVIVPLTFAAGFWILWGLLRAVGAPREGPQVAQPPLCEFCGYNLSVTPIEGRCPECGRLVIQSLGSEARAGSAWQQRSKVGWLRAYARTATGAIFAPVSLGRRLRLYAPGTDHRPWVAWHCVLIGFVSWAGFLLSACCSIGVHYFTKAPMLYFRGLFVGSLCGGAALGLLFLSAGAIGLFSYAGYRRNLLAASCQMACYLSPSFMFLVMFAWVSGAAFLATDGAPFERLATIMRVNQMFLARLVWTLLNLLWLALWLLALWRGTVAARYANR